MNKSRRKQINDATEKLDEIRMIIEQIKDEEQDAQDNLPESFVDRFDKMQEAIDILEEAESDIQNAIDGLMGIE